jgi:hypothetical protein
MAMSKKDFIALADTLRELQPDMAVPTWQASPQTAAERNGRQAQWLKTRDALADFCRSQSSNFLLDRWLGYIAGENGKNGGAIK